MGAVETLRAWGILRPEITIRAAADARLELAAACVVVMKESTGGRMIWGHDGQSKVPPARRTEAQGAVIYEFGGPVTPENYLRYRAAQRAGIIPRQGVGDCQLTSEEYLARAEALGGPAGPADPYINQLAGFTGLANLMRSYGDQQGFRRYNGSGPDAEAYAVKAMGLLRTWRDRIGPYTPPPPAPRPAAPAPGRDWFDMATEQDLRRIVEEVVGTRLDTVVREVTQRIATRVDFGLLNHFTNHPVPAEAEKNTDTMLGVAANADGRAYEVRDLVLNAVLPELGRLAAAVEARPGEAAPAAGGGGLTGEQVLAAVTAALATAPGELGIYRLVKAE